MKLAAVELKAIGWYAKKHDAVPQLSAWPVFRFKKRNTVEPEFIEENINSITLQYKEVLKEEAKERARAKRQSEKVQKL